MLTTTENLPESNPQQQPTNFQSIALNTLANSQSAANSSCGQKACNLASSNSHHIAKSVTGLIHKQKPFNSSMLNQITESQQITQVATKQSIASLQSDLIATPKVTQPTASVTQDPPNHPANRKRIATLKHRNSPTPRKPMNTQFPGNFSKSSATNLAVTCHTQQSPINLPASSSIPILKPIFRMQPEIAKYFSNSLTANTIFKAEANSKLAIQPTDDGKYRYKAIVSYDGRWFSGWQRQDGQLSVQEVLENALSQLANQPIQLTVAGRTDAGVHALGQTIHFDFPKLISEFHLVSGVNHYIRQFFAQAKQQLLTALPAVSQGILLPAFLTTITQPIAMLSCQPTSPTFNSRFDSRDKTYLYRIFTGRHIDPLEEGRGWHLWNKLDPSLMQQAGNILLGEHDFSSFRDAACQAKTPNRCINSLQVVSHPELLEIIINGNAFLHHMVRNIVGTLQLFGKGKLQPVQMQQILAARDRRCAGPTAPACGLYLVAVYY